MKLQKISANFLTKGFLAISCYSHYPQSCLFGTNQLAIPPPFLINPEAFQFTIDIFFLYPKAIKMFHELQAKYSKGLGLYFLSWFQGDKRVDFSMTCLWRKLGQLKCYCLGYQVKIQLNVMICGWDRWSWDEVAWFRNLKFSAGLILIEDLNWICVMRIDYWLLK